MTPHSKSAIDTAPEALRRMLPRYWKVKWSAGDAKKYTQAPEGHRAVTVRVGDVIHTYAVPLDVPLITLKCALRWAHGGQACHGKDGCYTVEF